MLWDNTLNELFIKTGFTRWPLLACSILGVAIIVERIIYYYRIRFDYEQFSRDLFIQLRGNQLMKAIHFCQERNHPIAEVAGAYLKNLNNKRRDSILTRVGSVGMEKVEKRLKGLATITHVSPLLGLLGTVTGLVGAFHAIELAGGQVQAHDLASGIWEALISTVFGLVVAIPCMVAYHSFESQADTVARRMKTIATELDEFFGNQSVKLYEVKNEEQDADSSNAVQ
jgi:biopolymer transport protein ExbB